MKKRRVIILVLLFLVVQPALINNMKETYMVHVAKNYLADTYDFEWKIEKVTYDLIFTDQYIMEVRADSGDIEAFTLYVDFKEGVVSDSYLEAYTQKRLEVFFQEKIEEIWGKDVEMSVDFDCPRLCWVPQEYSCETPLEILMSGELRFLRQDLYIHVESEMNEDDIVEKMWETAVFIQNNFSDWECVTYHVIGTESSYSIFDIKKVVSREYIVDNLKEVKINYK